MPVFAAVDIGSNSVRLSIAELRRGRLVPLHQDREVTRLGEGVFRDGNLEPQAMAQTLKVLRRFHRAVQSYAVERTRVIGTSALRDSNSARLFEEWVKTVTGWTLEIITGLEEGRLIHLGVISSLRTPPAKMLLIDLGGGSCELTLSEKGHIKEIVTLPLGAVRLTQEFIHHDPPTKPELKRLHDFIVQEAANVSRKMTRVAIHSVIATSGPAASLKGSRRSWPGGWQKLRPGSGRPLRASIPNVPRSSLPAQRFTRICSTPATSKAFVTRRWDCVMAFWRRWPPNMTGTRVLTVNLRPTGRTCS